MAYVKPQLMCQDMPLTFQMVNLLQTNLEEGWLRFGRWHGTREYQVGSFGIATTPPPGLLYGAHNDKRIPRVTARAYGVSLSSGSISSPSFVSNVPGVLGQVTRQAVGVVDVRVFLTDYYAVCTPFGSGLAGALRFVEPTAIYANQGATPALRFELFEMVGGAFVPADFDFVAHIYGTP
jgi:hypothetical protein